MNNNLVDLRKLAKRFSPDKWIFQPAQIGNESSYLVYTPADGDPNGYFRQEDGGVVWYSEKYPHGEPCNTRVLSKEEGDKLLELAATKTSQENMVSTTRSKELPS